MQINFLVLSHLGKPLNMMSMSMRSFPVRAPGCSVTLVLHVPCSPGVRSSATSKSLIRSSIFWLTFGSLVHNVFVFGFGFALPMCTGLNFFFF